MFKNSPGKFRIFLIDCTLAKIRSSPENSLFCVIAY